MVRSLPTALSSVLAVLFASSAPATVIHVNPDGTGDAPSIAAAYAMAEFGDEISLAPGVYYEHDIQMKSLIDLYGVSSDPTDTIVDAQGLGRCLYGPGVTGAPEVRDITFRNGAHAEEGGILLAGQGGTGGGHNVRYLNCIFRNGSAPRGGAVASGTHIGSDPKFFDCLFVANEATVTDGGAYWSSRGAGWAYGCTFRDNSAARHGGAAYSFKEFDWGFQPWGCTFEDNTAGEDGGAIYSDGFGDVYGSAVQSCRFEGNSATNGGAARLCEYDVVAGCTFVDNFADGVGGALLLWSIEPDEDYAGNYASNVFTRNSAGSAGGALAIQGSPSLFWVNRTTFVANGSPDGGHVWSTAAPHFQQCIFAFATDGGAATGDAPLSTGCLDAFGNVGGDYAGALAGAASVPTNFSADPHFCDLFGGDYTLREDSPCAPANSGGCGLVGALGVECGPVSVERRSWTRIRADYR